MKITDRIRWVDGENGWLTVPAGYEWSSYTLALPLLVNFQIKDYGIWAWAYFTKPEQGAGDTVTDALADLLTSISDYHLFLENRTELRGPVEEKDHALLQRLLGVVDTSEQQC